MRKTLRKRKAVSPVIAALLLIAIAVAAAVITYSWIMTMVGSQSRQAQTAMRMEIVSYYHTNPNYGIKMTIRNTGTTAAYISTFYLYDGDTLVVKQDDIGYSVIPGDLADIGITNNTSWDILWGGAVDHEADIDDGVQFANSLVLAHNYRIKIVTDTGFTVEGTYPTPGAW